MPMTNYAKPKYKKQRGMEIEKMPRKKLNCWKS